MNNQPLELSDQQINDGVLIIDKPAGPTSHDVVARVRKIMKTRRVGHTGTLDPFATGVLVVCVNRATRLAQFLTSDDKEYVATVRLGFCTDTGDLTGSASSPVADARDITTEQVNQALANFRGPIKQIPPMYSAKKIGGVKLYEMARRGEQILREPVDVEIKELELCEPIENAPLADTSGLPVKDFSFRVVCSSGTYIRTLAEEVGQRLGVGGHLVALRRTRAGSCDLRRAVTLEALEQSAQTDRSVAQDVQATRPIQVLIPMSDAISMTELQISEADRNEISHGRSIKRTGTWRRGERAKLCDHQRQLIAIAEYDDDDLVWRPRVVFNT